MHYDNYFWIPKSEVSRDFLVENLRIYGEGFSGRVVRDAFVEEGEYYGVAREWGLSYFDGDDETVFPSCKFRPKIKYTPKHNQEECIDSIVDYFREHNGCLLDAKTGWGKTVAGIQIAAEMQTPTLVIVPKEDLLKRWKAEYERWFKGECGHIQGKKQKYKDCNFAVTTFQTMYSQLDKLPKDFFQQWGLIIFDEGHKAASDSFIQVVNSFPARYRLGVSATWRRKDRLDPLWDLSIGPIVAVGEKTQSNLKKRYTVIDVDFGITDGKMLDYKKDISFAKCCSLIAESSELNDWLAEVMLNMSRNDDWNVLFTGHRISQIEELEKRLPEDAVGIYVGKYKGKKLKDDQLDEAIVKPIILSTIKKIELGTDIPRLDALIIGGPLSDPEQIVGRVARDYEGKTEFVVVLLRFVKSGYCKAILNKALKWFSKNDFELISHDGE